MDVASQELVVKYPRVAVILCRRNTNKASGIGPMRLVMHADGNLYSKSKSLACHANYVSGLAFASMGNIHIRLPAQDGSAPSASAAHMLPGSAHTSTAGCSTAHYRHHRKQHILP